VLFGKVTSISATDFLDRLNSKMSCVQLDVKLCSLTYWIITVGQLFLNCD